MSELWHSAIAEYSADEMSMDEYFEHWGVKGMKWGVRRYQNADGSLTEAGRRRYSEGAEQTQQPHDIPKLTKAAKEDSHRSRRVAANVTNAAIGAGIVGTLAGALSFGSLTVPGAALGAGIAAGAKALGRAGHIAARKIAQFIKDRKRAGENAPSVDEVNNIKGIDKEQVKERRKAETKCLAKAVEGGTFGKKVLDYINSKMSKETKKGVLEFDKKLREFNDIYGLASNSEKRRMNQETMATMQRRARDMLRDMGWAPTEQNIYYLTQIVWGNEND